MRLLHLSDLHIGKRVNEFSMLEDQRYALEGVLQTVRERDVDALLVAGDLYDKSAPSAEAVALVGWFLSEAADTGATVLVTAGNHDSAERVAYGSSFFAQRGVFLSPLYAGSISPIVLEDEHGPVAFWLIPFLKPATVRPWFPDEDIETYTDALRCAVGSCTLDPTLRNVALSHQFLTYGGVEPERCDSELSLGGMDNVDSSVFDDFDYVALGHIHRPQRVGRDEVRYSGSLLKYSFSEANDRKSAPLVELGPKGQVSIELVPIVPRHDLRTLHDTLEALLAAADEQGGGTEDYLNVVLTDGQVSIELVPIVPRHDLRTLHDTLEALLAAADEQGGGTEDYLNVVLTDEHPILDALSRLRRVYPNIMGISYDNRRTRLGGRAGAPAVQDASKIDPLELFEQFYLDQNGSPMTDNQRALAIGALETAQVM